MQREFPGKPFTTTWTPAMSTRMETYATVASQRSALIGCETLWSMMSSVGDGYLNLRYRPRFEPPFFQRVDRDLIEKRIAGAFRHCCTGNVAARGIDGHNANAAASNMGTPRMD